MASSEEPTTEAIRTAVTRSCPAPVMAPSSCKAALSSLTMIPASWRMFSKSLTRLSSLNTLSMLSTPFIILASLSRMASSSNFAIFMAFVTRPSLFVVLWLNRSNTCVVYSSKGSSSTSTNLGCSNPSRSASVNPYSSK